MRHYIYPLVALLALMVLTPSVCSAQRKSQREIERSLLPDSLSRSYRHAEAVKLLKIKGDTAQAKEIWCDLIAQDSTYAPALYQMAILEDGSALGLEYSRRAFAADTTNKWYGRMYGAYLISARKFSQAIPIYRRIIQIAPKDIDSYHTLAALYNYNSMPYTAISVLDSAEIHVGYSPYIGEMKLDILLETYQYERAMEEGKKGVLEQPYSAHAHIKLAEAYERSGRDSLARISLENALKIDSVNYDALNALSAYYERKGDHNSMLDYEERILMSDATPLSIKLNRVSIYTSNRSFYSKNYIRIGSFIQRLAIAHPNNRKVVDCYAEHLIALGELEQAFDYLSRHLADEETTAQHYIDAIQLAAYLEREETTKSLLEEAIARYPTNIDIRLYAGYYAMEYGTAEEAIAIFTATLDICTTDEERSQIYGNIGDIYHEEGNDNKAFKAYRKALAYNDRNVLVLNNYAYFLALQDKDLQRALTMSQLATEIEPNNATYVDTLAWVLHRMGRNKEAKGMMRQALSLSAQSDASLLAHYGDILWVLGESFMAETYWQKAVTQGYDKEAMEAHIAEIKASTENEKRKKR